MHRYLTDFITNRFLIQQVIPNLNQIADSQELHPVLAQMYLINV